MKKFVKFLAATILTILFVIAIIGGIIIGEFSQMEYGGVRSAIAKLHYAMSKQEPQRPLIVFSGGSVPLPLSSLSSDDFGYDDSDGNEDSVDASKWLESKSSIIIDVLGARQIDGEWGYLISQSGKQRFFPCEEAVSKPEAKQIALKPLTGMSKVYEGEDFEVIVLTNETLIHEEKPGE